MSATYSPWMVAPNDSHMRAGPLAKKAELARKRAEMTAQLAAEVMEDRLHCDHAQPWWPG